MNENKFGKKKTRQTNSEKKHYRFTKNKKEYFSTRVDKCEWLTAPAMKYTSPISFFFFTFWIIHKQTTNDVIRPNKAKSKKNENSKTFSFNSCVFLHWPLNHRWKKKKSCNNLNACGALFSMQQIFHWHKQECHGIQTTPNLTKQKLPLLHMDIVENISHLVENGKKSNWFIQNVNRTWIS